MTRIRGFAIAASLAAGLAAMAAAERSSGFDYDPVPRWAEEQETEAVCEAILQECASQMKDGGIEANWGYAGLYDANGFLVGLRSTASTGCKPLDEHMLLGHRRFATAFTKDGQPDLENIAVETAPAVSREGIRLVKRGETQVSMGC